MRYLLNGFQQAWRAILPRCSPDADGTLAQKDLMTKKRQRVLVAYDVLRMEAARKRRRHPYTRAALPRPVRSSALWRRA